MLPDEVSQPVKKDYTVWFLVGGVVVFLIVIIVGIFVGVSMINSAIKKSQVIPTPVPTIILEPTIVVAPNKYASDSGLLKIRDDLKNISGNIDSVDLFEPQIAPPAVDLGLNIK